jgi:hypothetical protein
MMVGADAGAAGVRPAPSIRQDMCVTDTSDDRVGASDAAPADDFAEFTETLLATIADARRRLSAAAATADSLAVAEALDRLEEALSTAREAGIEVARAERDGDGMER